MAETVTIKGTSEGLVIRLGSGPLNTVLDEMAARLEAKASFFIGGRVALRVGDRPLSAEQLQLIGSKLEEHGVTLWAVDGEHPITRAAARELGLETPDNQSAWPVRLQATGLTASYAAEQIPREEMVGIVVRRTLRSGQAIHHVGHVTLIGDVNPGAEIVAGGDIIVWGKLLGTVHAGAMGDEQAVVCALELAPSQIRIGSHIARSPGGGRPPRMPEIASVQEDRIVVEGWSKSGWRLDVGSLKLKFWE
jgi:septum site-determining protein MinC